MATQLDRQSNGTIEIHLSVPWTDIQKSFEKEVQKAIENAELPGFRKGKAPREMVEPKLDKDHLYSDALESLLPVAYSAAIKEHSLHPILYPRIKVTKAEPDKDWEFTASVCETPVVEIQNLREIVKKVTGEPKEGLLSRILEELHKNIPVKVPDLLVEEESNHRLSTLADNLTKLGLNTESYLQTKKQTPESLKSMTSTQSRTDLETEFILETVRSSEKLTDRAKTLDFLIGLV